MINSFFPVVRYLVVELPDELTLSSLLSGIWLLHCHVEFHNAIGMALLIQVGERSQFPRRPKNFPTCGDWRYTGLEDDDDDDDNRNGNSTCGAPSHDGSFVLLLVIVMCVVCAMY